MNDQQKSFNRIKTILTTAALLMIIIVTYYYTAKFIVI